MVRASPATCHISILFALLNPVFRQYCAVSKAVMGWVKPGTYTKTRLSSSAESSLTWSAWRTLLARWIGAM